MTIEFSCSGCGRTYKVDDSRVGMKTKCKGCEAVLTVPAAGPPTSKPALMTFNAPPGNGPAKAAGATKVARPPLQSFGAPAAATDPIPAMILVPDAPPADDIYGLDEAEALPPIRPMAPAPEEGEGDGGRARPGKVGGKKKGKRLSQPGSFGQRFGATFLDGLLVALPLTFAVGLLQGPAPQGDPSDPAVQQEMLRVGAVNNLLAALLLAVYYFAMECSPLRASLGKLAMGLRVVGDDGRPTSAMLAGFRVALRMVSYIFVVPWVISGFIVLFGSEKKALHDKFSGTLVATKR